MGFLFATNLLSKLRQKVCTKNKKPKLKNLFIRSGGFGWITKDVYDKKHQEYADQLQLLEIELSEHREADYEYQTTVSTLVSVARRAREIFDNCSEPMQKRAFLNFLLQNPSVKGKKLCFTIASPFNLVLDLADCPDLLPVVDKFRTLDWREIEQKLGLSALFSELLP